MLPVCLGVVCSIRKELMFGKLEGNYVCFLYKMVAKERVKLIQVLIGTGLFVCFILLYFLY